jgi:transcriptional regulator of met regulon
MMFKSYIDNDLQKAAKLEGEDVYSALSNAKDLHIQKENLYGKTSQLPFRKIIDNQALETIVDDISKSKQSITNTKALKEELKLLPNGDKILGSLARSFIDESLQKSKLTNSVYSSKEINSKEVLKAFDSMDYRQLEILTDKDTVEKLHNIRKLTELIMKQDKVLNGTGGGLNTMGMVRSSIVDKVLDFMKIRAFGKIVTTPVTQDLLHKALKNASDNKLDEADKAIKELDTLIKEK